MNLEVSFKLKTHSRIDCLCTTATSRSQFAFFLILYRFQGSLPLLTRLRCLALARGDLMYYTRLATLCQHLFAKFFNFFYNSLFNAVFSLYLQQKWAWDAAPKPLDLHDIPQTAPILPVQAYAEANQKQPIRMPHLCTAIVCHLKTSILWRLMGQTFDQLDCLFYFLNKLEFSNQSLQITLNWNFQISLCK